MLTEKNIKKLEVLLLSGHKIQLEYDKRKKQVKMLECKLRVLSDSDKTL